MIVLAMDSATPRLVAGVVELDPAGEVRTLSEVTDHGSRRHAEVLTPAIHDALRAAGTAPEAIVVGLGPGPFTGLRVGIVTAAAFGDALGVPVWGVGTHQAIADGRGDAVVISDARRREVYYSTYDESATQVSLGVAPLADVATGAPLNATIEIAGPEAAGMDELVRRHLAAKRDHRKVVADPGATYFGQPVDLRSLVPADGARLGATRLDAWLAADHAD